MLLRLRLLLWYSGLRLPLLVLRLISSGSCLLRWALRVYLDHLPGRLHGHVCSSLQRCIQVGSGCLAVLLCVCCLLLRVSLMGLEIGVVLRCML